MEKYLTYSHLFRSIAIVILIILLFSCTSIDTEMYYDYPEETDKEVIV